MTATKSKKATEADGGAPAFMESEHEATLMTYGPGKVPIYVIAVWAVAMVSLAAYFITYGIPDLSAWGKP
jgi:hypothetical protein